MKRHAADPTIESRRKVPPPTETDPVIEALVQDIIAKVADKWTMLILEVLEEIPAAGTRVRISQYDIDILDVQENMIKQVKVVPVKPLRDSVAE